MTSFFLLVCLLSLISCSYTFDPSATFVVRTTYSSSSCTGAFNSATVVQLGACMYIPSSSGISLKVAYDPSNNNTFTQYLCSDNICSDCVELPTSLGTCVQDDSKRFNLFNPFVDQLTRSISAIEYDEFSISTGFPTSLTSGNSIVVQYNNTARCSGDYTPAIVIFPTDGSCTEGCASPKGYYGQIFCSYDSFLKMATTGDGFVLVSSLPILLLSFVLSLLL